MEDKETKIGLLIIASVAVITLIVVGGKGLINALDALNPFSKDETDKDLDRAEALAEKRGYFSPAFIKNSPAGTALLTKKGAEAKARNIWDSIGFVYDEPEKTKAQFSTLITKSQVSHLAKVFNEMFHKDLLSWLVLKLDTDAQQKVLTQILNRLDSLPDFRSDKQTSKTAIAKPYQPLITNLGDFMKRNEANAQAKKPVFKVPPFDPKNLI